jgi:hypothetical protein
MSDQVTERELPPDETVQTPGGGPLWLPALLGVLCTLCVVGLIIGIALAKSGAF